MNAVEIEQAISELAGKPFDRQEFPFQFLEAFGFNPLYSRIGRGTWASRLIGTIWRYGERVAREQDHGSGRLRGAV